MIIATYMARAYAPDLVRSRYARCQGGFFWCEVGEDRRFDLRQGTCAEGDLPAAVVAEARRREGVYPSYAEWPLEDRS